MTIPLDTSKPFKLNANMTGVCECIPPKAVVHFALTSFLDRVLYSPERTVAIAKELAKEGSPFSLEDKIGIVWDALALARAGYLKLSAVLSLYDALRNEKECKSH